MNFAGVKAVVSVSALAFVTMFAVQAAQADVILTISQDGSNVVATASGTINTAGLSIGGDVGLSGSILPSQALVGVGADVLDETANGIAGPSSFGPGGSAFASTTSGDSFGVAYDSYVFLPNGYVSGSELSGTATWDNATVASLGLTPGTYSYTWGSGADADSFTVDVEAPAPPAATPEPSSLALLGSGVLGLAGLVRRRMKR